MTEHLIEHARVGSVPGIDFGPTGEDHIRLCFARGRAEIQGALDSMRSVFRNEKHVVSR
jgi:aspartate/methionine/tyrosine aminotransferase